MKEKQSSKVSQMEEKGATDKPFEPGCSVFAIDRLAEEQEQNKLEEP
jgi:hypothetical protein